MFKFSLLSMTISSSFLFFLLSVCQIGPDWEVPQNLIRKMVFASDFGILFFAISCILFLLSVKRFLQLDKVQKSIYLIWGILITCAIVIIFAKGTPVDAFRIYNNSISKVAANSVVPGIAISVILFVYLAFGEKRITK
ncbi:MAG TPA: hypothetical protein VHT96_11170 [Clostridia bacterium]|nr:hypothetical protein [Clostridia bacterium]